MILPNKSIGLDLALITIGAQILEHLDSPATVNAIWDRVTSARTTSEYPSALPFWWFALALDLLFSLGAIEISHGELARHNATATD